MCLKTSSSEADVGLRLNPLKLDGSRNEDGREGYMSVMKRI